jgi:hypothetical protein
MNLFVLHRVFIKCCLAKVFVVIGVLLKKVRSKWPSPRRCGKGRLYLKEVKNVQHPEIRPLTSYPQPPLLPAVLPPPSGPSSGKEVTNHRTQKSTHSLLTPTPRLGQTAPPSPHRSFREALCHSVSILLSADPKSEEKNILFVKHI